MKPAGWLAPLLLLGCVATTTRPYFQPVPSAAVAEIELGIPEATRALAEGMARDSIALSTIREGDGYIDSGWLDARTLEHTTARPLGADVVRVRAWINPAKQFWSELSVEATFRPMADPSRPERELDVPLPEEHPLQKRLSTVLQQLIVQYGDAEALREFQLKMSAAAKADSLARALKAQKPDSLSQKPDSTKADSLKAKTDTTKIRPDSLKAKRDTSKVKPDSLKAKPDTAKVKPDTTRNKPHPTAT
jgi:hypothetical protein